MFCRVLHLSFMVSAATELRRDKKGGNFIRGRDGVRQLVEEGGKVFHLYARKL